MAELTRWCNAAGWQTVLNRAGTTFRKLPDADKQGLTQDKAIGLMNDVKVQAIALMQIPVGNGRTAAPCFEYVP